MGAYAWLGCEHEAAFLKCSDFSRFAASAMRVGVTCERKNMNGKEAIIETGNMQASRKLAYLGCAAIAALLAVFLMVAPAANGLFGQSADAHAASKSSQLFSVNKKKVVLLSKKTRTQQGLPVSASKATLKVKARIGAELRFECDNSDVAKVKWGKWSGNSCKLSIVARQKGKANITLTNSKTSKKIKVKVIVR